MSEEKTNRVVVVDEHGGERIKTDEEISKENSVLEDMLNGGPSATPDKPEEKLDPALLAKLRAKKEKKENAEKKTRSLNFGVIGLGQAGSRVAEKFHDLGYMTCVMNTATQDLEYINIPDERKILLPFALGGAGKDLHNGREAVEQNAELIIEKLNNVFDESNEILILAVSGGGGTGSGGAEAMIGLLSTLKVPVGVIYILPMESEDSLSKHNSVTTLSKLAKMASTDIISSLVIVDNAKIELIYPGLSKAEFWPTANTAIVGPLHLFNYLSSIATPYDSLDSMDFSRILLAGDCTTYGMIEVEDYMETTSIAEAVLENLESGLLASDFGLKEARFGGFIVVGNPEVMRALPAENIHYASHMISETCDYAQVTRGVYEMSEVKGDIVRIYTMFSGLGLPSARIESLKEQAKTQMEQIREKENTRSSRMAVDYGAENETSRQANEIHRLIKQNKSAFGKITKNANKGKVVDRRRG
jgi:cell division GTPase FtsZ